MWQLPETRPGGNQILTDSPVSRNGPASLAGRIRTWRVTLNNGGKAFSSSGVESNRALGLIILISLLYGTLAFFRLGSFDLDSDEGRFGLSAINILADYRQLATVSEKPLGGPGTKPYLYPLSLAVSISLLGKTEFALRAVSAVALAFAALLLYGLVRVLLEDRAVALFTFAFFLLNPWTITYSRCALPEPLVVLWGCIALFAAARFCKDNRLAWAAICGVALGFAFLSKLWLFFPFLLGCLLFFSVKPAATRKRNVTGLVLALFLLGLVSASHLLLVLCLAPTQFSHWVDLYFVVSLQSRVQGPGYDPAMWYRSDWFYLTHLFKASFWALPLVFLGMQKLVKQRNFGVATIVAALLSCVPVLSLFHVKQTSYIFPTCPALALLMALGWVYLVSEAEHNEIAVASLLSMAVAALAYHNGVIRLPVLAAILGLYIGYCLVYVTGLRENGFVRTLVATGMVSAVVLAGAVVVRQTLLTRTYYRDIAAYFQPQLESRDARDLVFVSPRFPAMEFYTFRSGEYWETFYFKKDIAVFVDELRQGGKVFYVVDPSGNLYGGKVTPEKLNALNQHGLDITAEIERFIGHKIPLRVYVRANNTKAALSSGIWLLA